MMAGRPFFSASTLQETSRLLHRGFYFGDHNATLERENGFIGRQAGEELSGQRKLCTPGFQALEGINGKGKLLRVPRKMNSLVKGRSHRRVWIAKPSRDRRKLQTSPIPQKPLMWKVGSNGAIWSFNPDLSYCTFVSVT